VYLTVMCIGDMLCACMNPQCAVLFVRCYGNHLLVDNCLFTRCIYDISVCKTKILDPKNMENDILHAIFGHVVDEIHPILVRCYGNRLFVDNYLFTRCIYDICVCKTEILDPKNVENDILHATFGHILDEIQPTDSDVGHIGFLAQ